MKEGKGTMLSTRCKTWDKQNLQIATYQFFEGDFEESQKQDNNAAVLSIFSLCSGIMLVLEVSLVT